MSSLAVKTNLIGDSNAEFIQDHRENMENEIRNRNTSESERFDEKFIREDKDRVKRQIQRASKTKLASVCYFLFQVWFSIIGWAFLLAFIVIPIAPLVVTYFIVKCIENWLYCKAFGAEAVYGGDVVWMQNGPENRGIISALLVFDGQMDLELFRKRIVETMIKKPSGQIGHPYRRSLKRVSKGLFNVFWTEEDEFNIDEHIREWPDVATSKEMLRHIMSQICNLPFPAGMSQWEFVVIPSIENGACKTNLMFRLHHSLADGVSLVNYLTKVLPDNKSHDVPLKKFTGRDRILMTLKGTLLSPLFLMKMLTVRADQTILHGKPLTGQKLVTWSDPLDIRVVKKIKAATKTTLNDVLVTCVTASVREYFIKRDLAPPQDLSVSIPIDLRNNTDKDAVEFENRFAVLQLALPTGVSDPLAMLSEVQSRMNDKKTSGEPFAVGPTMDMLLNILPACIISPIFDFIVQKTTGVLSNLPGPPNVVRVVGHELKLITFWAPTRGNLGMTFSITSYNGKIVVGVQSDSAILDNPDEICKEFHGQVKCLMNRLNLSD